MNKGYSLIEVMVSLLILMVVFVAVSKVVVLGIRSNGYSEALTVASVLGHTKLIALNNLPSLSPNLDLKWHEDPDNPIKLDNTLYYRFWEVNENSLGKQVYLYVVWDDHRRSFPGKFNSLAEIKSSGFPVVVFSDLFPHE